uniref:Uncharacterized protein n=1 Tax=Triticum urartu TaxID=4572 RepID=A0A8R7TDJ7_TRIUA
PTPAPTRAKRIAFHSRSIHTRSRAALLTPLISPANRSRRPVASRVRRRRASSPRRDRRQWQDPKYTEACGSKIVVDGGSRFINQ